MMKKLRKRALSKAKWDLEVHENKMYWTARFSSSDKSKNNSYNIPKTTSEG
jgi:hypothetical protein